MASGWEGIGVRLSVDAPTLQGVRVEWDDQTGAPVYTSQTQESLLGAGDQADIRAAAQAFAALADDEEPSLTPADEWVYLSAFGRMVRRDGRWVMIR